MLNNLDYYTIAPNRRIAEFRVDGDSLSLSEKKGASVVKETRYAINSVEKREDYFLLYVKRTFPPASPRAVRPNPPYGLFVVSFSKDKNRLLVLHEDKLWYVSDEEAKSANRDVDFGNKYFQTYYSAGQFASFIHGRDLNETDSATLRKITDALVAEMRQQRGKVINTQRWDIYGGGTMQDMQNKILIDYHFNPTVSTMELGKKIEEYHIPLPKTAPMRNPAGGQGMPGIDTDHLKPYKIH
jgi:hypothetical protein